MSSSNSRNAKIQERFHSIINSQYNLQFQLKALINISKCIFYLYIKCRGQTNPNIYFFTIMRKNMDVLIQLTKNIKQKFGLSANSFLPPDAIE